MRKCPDCGCELSPTAHNYWYHKEESAKCEVAYVLFHRNGKIKRTVRYAETNHANTQSANL